MQRSTLRLVLILGVCYVTVACSAFAVSKLLNDKYWPIMSDQAGYYAYLPALFEEDGFRFMNIDQEPWPTFHSRGAIYFPLSEKTGRRMNQFSPGVALLHAPLFVTAYGVSWLTGIDPDRGYGDLCRLASLISGALYGTLGLLFLAMGLRDYVEDRTLFWSILILGIGTNFSHYAAIENLMSHVHSFFALSVVMWAVLRWNKQPEMRFAIIGGAFFGIAVLIRATNLMAVSIPVLFFALQKGPVAPLEKIKHASVAALCSAITVSPLFLYWWYATGSPFSNPYGEGLWFFEEPMFGSVLFSYRKGWFLWTPAMMLLVPGLWLLRKKIPSLAIALSVYLFLCLYLVSSYWSWWFGGAFGMRGMIESTGPLLIALAAFVGWALQSKFSLAFRGLFLLFIFLNLFQNYQYVQLYIPNGGVTKEIYWRVFLRPYISPEERLEIENSADNSWTRSPKDAQHFYNKNPLTKTPSTK